MKTFSDWRQFKNMFNARWNIFLNSKFQTQKILFLEINKSFKDLMKVLTFNTWNWFPIKLFQSYIDIFFQKRILLLLKIYNCVE